jgi:hypothetical protein
MKTFSSCILRPWRRRQHAPPKRRLTLTGLCGVIPEKVEVSLVTAVRTSTRTWQYYVHEI